MGNPALERGYVDTIKDDRVTLSGWVPFHTEPPDLEVLKHGVAAGQVKLGEERQDVLAATALHNRGFIVVLDEPATPLEMLCGAVQVTSRSVPGALPLAAGVRAREEAGALRYLAKAVPDAGKVVESVGVTVPHRLRENAREVAAAAAAGELTHLAFPVGLKSADNSAQLGRDGHIFLTQGSNALLDKYAPAANPAQAERREASAQTWAELIRTRQEQHEARNIHFTQVILPEKLTVLRHLAPFPIAGPTPLLTRIDELLQDDKCYVSGLDIFEDWQNPIPPWRRNDSHVSPAGALAITRALLDAMPGCGAGFWDDLVLNHRTYHDGDLASRFFGIPVWDEHLEPDPAQLESVSRNVQQVYSTKPLTGFNGTHHVWTNENAPIQKKVVVFANSYFGDGSRLPAKVSWWFARAFAEYHFRWEAEVDYDYVDDVRPDYVVAQTIERFIDQIPEN